MICDETQASRSKIATRQTVGQSWQTGAFPRQALPRRGPTAAPVTSTPKGREGSPVPALNAPPPSLECQRRRVPGGTLDR